MVQMNFLVSLMLSSELECVIGHNLSFAVTFLIMFLNFISHMSLESEEPISSWNWRLHLVTRDAQSMLLLSHYLEITAMYIGM